MSGRQSTAAAKLKRGLASCLVLGCETSGHHMRRANGPGCKANTTHGDDDGDDNTDGGRCGDHDEDDDDGDDDDDDEDDDDDDDDDGEG